MILYKLHCVDPTVQIEPWDVILASAVVYEIWLRQQCYDVTKKKEELII